MDDADLRSVVRERVPEPHARAAIAARIPCEPGARAEVVLVRFVQLIQSGRTELNETAIGEEVRRQLVALADRREDLVPQSETEGQTRRRLPVVVDERAD